MGFEKFEFEQRWGLKTALAAARISEHGLWMRYFSIGGSAGEYEVQAYLRGMLSLPVLERDLLAMAANELSNHGAAAAHAPYSDEIGSDQPARSEERRPEPDDGQV